MTSALFMFIDQLFSRMSLNLGLSNVSRFLDLKHASWQECITEVMLCAHRILPGGIDQDQ